jgi:hypothetical protein
MVNVTGKFLPFDMDPGLIGGPPKVRPPESIVTARSAPEAKTEPKKPKNKPL